MPAEFKLLSKKACEALAEMFNCIEEGASWPEQTTKARAAFLAKEEESDLDPLSYRVLLMLATAHMMLANIVLARRSVPAVFSAHYARDPRWHSHGRDNLNGCYQCYHVSAARLWPAPTLAANDRTGDANHSRGEQQKQQQHADAHAHRTELHESRRDSVMCDSKDTCRKDPVVALVSVF